MPYQDDASEWVARSGGAGKKPSRYGQYGTVQYMRKISALGRQTLLETRGADWAQQLGELSNQAINAKYGPNGHAAIGKIGGDKVSCKYWGKHCGNRSADYAALRRAGEQNAGSVSMLYGKSRKSNNDNNNDNYDWDNNNIDNYLYDNNDSYLYGKSRTSNKTSNRKSNRKSASRY